MCFGPLSISNSGSRKKKKYDTNTTKYLMEMNRILRFICLLLIISCAGPSDTTKASLESHSLPNIILLVGDDQGYPYSGLCRPRDS